MRARRSMVLAFAACLASGASAAAGPLTFQYVTTAANGGPGAGVTYTLQVSDDGAASLTVSSLANTTDSWYADWFTFKFDGSNKIEISGLTTPAGTGPWSTAYDQQVKVLGGGGNYSNLLPGGSTGFYVTSLALGNNPATETGVCLSGSCAASSAVFLFNLALSPEWTATEIPFQVGYYGGVNGSGATVVNRLSQVATVPDGGGTLALLGLALIGLGVVRRKFRA